ncbi:MAG TPA: hypothetical protein VJ692_11975 [Nitrospiraceae bacterium]|nr:hypothetical protein [Nitrospiraceae bacterium]
MNASWSWGARVRLAAGVLSFFILNLQPVFPLNGSTATTESSCNFGMAKGEAKQSCNIPFLQGCVVANFPGTTRPWSSISKGGVTTCRFNETQTDWKTRITGTCEQCKTEQCSARFGVMFDCSGTMPPPINQPPATTKP